MFNPTSKFVKIERLNYSKGRLIQQEDITNYLPADIQEVINQVASKRVEIYNIFGIWQVVSMNKRSLTLRNITQYEPRIDLILNKN